MRYDVCNIASMNRHKKYNASEKGKAARARYYSSDKGAANIRRKRDREKALRAEMIAAYGGKCECCGETTPEFLTIEHRNRDGAEHRAVVGNGAGIYRDLKKRGWPKDEYGLLCWNCNCATRFGQKCPHTINREEN